MRFCFVRELFISCVIVELCCLLLPQSLLAGTEYESLTSANLDFRVLQCPIMATYATSGYLLVCEKRVEILELKQGNSRLRTTLKNQNGLPITFSSLRQGQWVFVRGFEQPDGRILAREIYSLSDNIEGQELMGYDFVQKAPPWEWEKID